MKDLKLSSRIAVIGLLIAASLWMQAHAAGAKTQLTGTATVKRSCKINVVVPTNSFEEHERRLIYPVGADNKAKEGTQEPGTSNKYNLRKALEQKQFQAKERTRVLNISNKDAGKDLGQERDLVDHDEDYAGAKTHPPMEPPRR